MTKTLLIQFREVVKVKDSSTIYNRRISVHACTVVLCCSILVRANDLNMAPFHDANSAIVKSARVSNVDTVIIDGRIRKRDGALIGIDVSDVVTNAARSLHNVRTRGGGEWAPESSKVPTF